jgi:hypothetical protein
MNHFDGSDAVQLGHDQVHYHNGRAQSMREVDCLAPTPAPLAGPRRRLLTCARSN